MKTLLLNFDVEEFTKTSLESSPLGMEKILNLLSNQGIVSTFFTTLKFAESNPETINSLLKDGHELALHAYDHTHDYKTMHPDKAYKYISEAKQMLEKKFKTKIYGFRAPRFQAPPYSVIRKAGFLYDSTLHPTFIPGRYNKFRSPRHAFLEDNLIVIPVSVTPLLRMPFSWLWFRSLGLKYAKACTRLSLINQDFINIFFHSWEFLDLENSITSSSYKKNTGEKLVNMLEKYISFCKKLGMKPHTIKAYAEMVKNTSVKK
jgi:peptidoglycan/xylan/chitin deacetylase (PgdA/CDA1 family)